MNADKLCCTLYLRPSACICGKAFLFASGKQGPAFVDEIRHRIYETEYLVADKLKRRPQKTMTYRKNGGIPKGLGNRESRLSILQSGFGIPNTGGVHVQRSQKPQLGEMIATFLCDRKASVQGLG